MLENYTPDTEKKYVTLAGLFILKIFSQKLPDYFFIGS